MRRFICSLAVLAPVALLGLAAVAGADEEVVPLDKVPKVIMDAVKAKYPKAEVKGATKETGDDGKPVIEIEISEAGKTIDVTFTPEGKLIMIEQEIEAKDLPKEVVDALIDKYPKATIKLAEQIADGAGKVQAYELKIVTADNKALEIKFDPKGKVVP